ncbi:hypothetical protein DUI87_26558 [Hirundo rustica rustica]|uniref:Uncharacterized protein n=1 Tax=Hirundo rustica rustica TaxID=333673 RepID=A0A3M0J7W4_HIRRU|nr:hypothetical protein DUI87_26558 [Hirundo rustica rustica]
MGAAAAPALAHGGGDGGGAVRTPRGHFLLVLPVAAGRQEWRHSGNGGGPRTRSREPESIIINNFNEAAKSHSMLAVINGAGK